MNLEEVSDADKLFRVLADSFSSKFGIASKTVYKLLTEREAESSTAISDGLAIPHIIIDGKAQFEIVVARSKKGISFGKDTPPVHIVFALAGSRDERNFHLQVLMAIAQIVQNRDFLKSWGKADGIEDLRNLILLAERIRKGNV